jgi:hypothetical protein
MYVYVRVGAHVACLDEEQAKTMLLGKKRPRGLQVGPLGSGQSTTKTKEPNAPKRYRDGGQRRTFAASLHATPTAPDPLQTNKKKKPREWRNLTIAVASKKACTHPNLIQYEQESSRSSQTTAALACCA